jgi:hypothetical protein
MKFSFSKIRKKDSQVEIEPEATLKDYADIIINMNPTHVFLAKRLIWTHSSTSNLDKLKMVLDGLQTFPVYKVTCVEEPSGLRDVYIDT